MALRLSTGLVNKLLDTSNFKTAFANCFIDIYSGTQPASPNDAAIGTKLVTIYRDGVSLGLNLAASAVNGTIDKSGAETWSGNGLANGTAGWFRMREAGDSGTGASTTAARLDGSVATSGAQMNLGSLTVTIGAPVIISGASFTLPQS